MDLMQLMTEYKNNPLGLLAKRFNIPQDIKSPQDIVQHLLNTNQVTQEQVNRAMQMRNNPMFQQLFKK